MDRIFPCKDDRNLPLGSRPIHVYQFALYKNGSATIYNTGTMLVQGLGTCLDLKNNHYAELRALIYQSNIIAVNTSETDLKQLLSLNEELTTTVSHYSKIGT